MQSAFRVVAASTLIVAATLMIRAQTPQSQSFEVQLQLGDVLFSLVNVARLSAIDAEDALQQANEKFRRRFGEMEADFVARGRSVRDASPDELEHAWETAKERERVAPLREPSS